MLRTRIILYSLATLFFFGWVAASIAFDWGTTASVIGAVPMAILAGWEITRTQKVRNASTRKNHSE